MSVCDADDVVAPLVMRSNLLMVTDILALLLDAHHAALVRSAGWVGTQAFEENVELGRVPLCVVDPDEFPDLEAAPLRIPVGTCIDAVRVPIHTMIASIRALRLEGRDQPSLPQPQTPPQPAAAAGPPPPAVTAVDEHMSYYEHFEVENLICIRCDDLVAASKLAMATFPIHITVVGERAAFCGIPSTFLNFCSSIETARFVVPENNGGQTCSRAALAMAEQFANENGFDGPPSPAIFEKVCQAAGMVIAHSFMANCSSLAWIEMSALKNVAEVQTGFLENCSSLRAIDLAPLSRITRIPASFMAGTMSLKAIDLTPLANVTYISCEFLVGCVSLEAIDLSPFKNVTHIGEKFLAACRSLKVVDFTPLRNVAEVGPYFLGCCKGLSVVDISPMGNITSIPIGFLDEFKDRKVILPYSLRNDAEVAADGMLIDAASNISIAAGGGGNGIGEKQQTPTTATPTTADCIPDVTSTSNITLE